MSCKHPPDDALVDVEYRGTLSINLIDPPAAERLAEFRRSRRIVAESSCLTASRNAFPQTPAELYAIAYKKAL